MKFLLTVVVTAVLLAGFAAGQKAPPDPQGSSALPKTEEVATPSGTPEPQVAPDLLPESNQLPAEPPDLRWPSPSVLKIESPNATPNVPAVEQIISIEQWEELLRGQPHRSSILFDVHGFQQPAPFREVVRDPRAERFR